MLFTLQPHLSQTLPQVIHILHFCLIDCLLNYALVNWIEVRAVQQPQIWEFVGVTTIIALSVWRQ